MILFKTLKIEDEWNSPHLSDRLKFITHAVSDKMWKEFGVPLYITEIFRTWEMQQEYYKDDETFKLEQFHSVHEFWRGIDIRSSEMLEEDAKSLVEWINNQVIYGKEGKFTAKFHSIGLGFHIHLQVSANNETSLREK